jgi:hypothetical protein
MKNSSFAQAIGKRTPVNEKGSVTAWAALITQQEILDIFVHPIYAGAQPFRIQLKGYWTKQGQVWGIT